MGIPIQGSPSGTVAEVAANTLAMRVSERPMNIGAFGSYSVGVNNGTTVMTAGLAAAAPIFAFRGAAAAGPNCLVRRILFSAWTGTTGFAVTPCFFNLFVARAFTASDTGGSAVTMTTNNAKRRTSFATSAVQDIRFSATGTLSAGTRTLDAAALSSVTGTASATASTVLVPPTDLLRYGPEAWPLIIAPQEGFEIQATVPATGVWNYSVNVDWDEVPSTEI